MESSSEDDLVVLSLLKKKRGNSGSVIQSWDCVEIQESLLRDSVYFRMSVAQFDVLLAILKPDIKKKTPNFPEPIDL